MQARLIGLPVVHEPRGNLTFLQHPDHIPFKIKRTFWIYDVPGDKTRGGHAYHQQREFIIALSGSFTVQVRSVDGKTASFYLRRPNVGLLLPPLHWRSMEDFSTNALSLHLCDQTFTPGDRIVDYETFSTSE